MEKQLTRQNIYEGKVIKVVKDDVVLDDGSKTIREVVLHNGGVCIALRDGDYFYMVKQYRYGQGKDMLEFPAGKIEKGENPDEAILREVVEETGYSTKNIVKLGSMVPTCGYSSEVIHLYYGEVDKHLGQHFDEDERIDLFKYTYQEIKQMIMDEKVDDGKTIALMFKISEKGLHA